MSIGRRLTITLLLALSATALVPSSAHGASTFIFHLYTKTGAYATASNFTYQYTYIHPTTGMPVTVPPAPAYFTTNPQTFVVPPVSPHDVRVTFTITYVP